MRVVAPHVPVACLIDDDQFEAIRRYSWRLKRDGYLGTKIGRAGTRRDIEMHLFLFGPAGDGLVWDHINRNKLDNRRENLRKVTRLQNGRNFSRSHRNRSGIPGISYHHGSWRVRISKRCFGVYRCWEAAVIARAKAEKECWGWTTLSMERSAAQALLRRCIDHMRQVHGL